MQGPNRLLALVAALLLVASATAAAPVPPPSDFEESITEAGLFTHLNALLDIANLPANGGSRAVFAGYNDSLNYVKDLLEQHTNYHIRLQAFDAQVSRYPTPPKLAAFSPEANDWIEFALDEDFVGFNFVAAADVEAPAQLVRGGCLPGDFDDFVPGRIALMNRAPHTSMTDQQCSYRIRTDNAVVAGAAAVLLYNANDLLPTLGNALPGTPVPVFGITSAVGYYLAELSAAGTPATVRVNSSCEELIVETYNLLADTHDPTTVGPRSTIVVGAHLDSVPNGPGINDNGSGSVGILELALHYATEVQPSALNPVRFAWWSGEEWGLYGSKHYVENLTPAEHATIAVNLNFDMLGSPNFVRGIYDGRNGPEDVKFGSGNVQGLFEDYFDARGKTYIPTPFNGRSDYGPFIETGIPACGLAAGAEEIKTLTERQLFGGTQYAPLDPCYHRACDDVDNISGEAIESLSRAAAYVLETLATMTDLEDFLFDN